MRRRDDPTFWQSITGSLLVDEVVQQAALRELEEETGFTCQHGDLKDCQTQWWFTIYPHWRYRYPPGTTQNLEHVFLFTLKHTQEIQLSNEHSEYRWLSKKEAMELMRSETNKQAIELFVEES